MKSILGDEFENCMFRSGPVHGLKKIVLEENCLTLIMAPWSDLDDEVTAVFKSCRIKSMEFEDDEDPMPWDMIGMGCTENKDDAFFFSIHTAGCDLNFTANWPEFSVKPGGLPVILRQVG